MFSSLAKLLQVDVVVCQLMTYSNVIVGITISQATNEPREMMMPTITLLYIIN